MGPSIPQKNYRVTANPKTTAAAAENPSPTCSLLPPMSLYVTSGFSSTVIIVTLGSILGGSGICIWYLLRSTPTRMPSSMSVGATRSPSPTTNLAICLTLMTYFASSVLGLMILVQRATWG